VQGCKDAHRQRPFACLGVQRRRVQSHGAAAAGRPLSLPYTTHCRDAHPDATQLYRCVPLLAIIKRACLPCQVKCACACAHACLPACLRACVHACLPACTCICYCVRTCVHACMRVCMSSCAFLHVCRYMAVRVVVWGTVEERQGQVPRWFCIYECLACLQDDCASCAPTEYYLMCIACAATPLSSARAA